MNGSRLQTVSGTKMQNATVVVISTKEQVNSSVCHISSLEVYRGEGQTTKISHQGFSLGSSGTIEVNNSCDYNNKYMLFKIPTDQSRITTTV